MSTFELTACLTLLGLCFIGMMTGVYFFGFSRGAKSLSTPEVVEEVEEPWVEIGYLAPSTGPISISTTTASLEIVAVPAGQIEFLTAKLERAERLRKRYLRLLREERAMMLSFFTPTGLKLSPYWDRWVKQRARLIDEAFAAADWGGQGIANTH